MSTPGTPPLPPEPESSRTHSGERPDGIPGRGARGSALGAWAADRVSRPWAGGLWLPIPLLTLLIGVLWGTGWKVPYELPFLLVGSNLLFATLAALASIWLVSRSFALRGRPGDLFFGCGLLVWSAAGVAVSAVAGGDPNQVVTVHTVSLWLASLCHLAGVLLDLRWPARTRLAGAWLWVAYLLVLASVGLITAAGGTGWFGLFFRQGQGGTLARQLVMVSAMATYITTALLVSRHWPASPRRRYYAMGLWLVVVGLFGGFVQPSAASLVGWAGRAAQYLSGIYLTLSALASFRESGGEAVQDGDEEPSLSYLLAILLVLAGAALRLTALRPLGGQSAFIGFYPAVVLAALFGGLRAGILATLLSAMVGQYLWMGEWGFTHAGVAGFLGLGVFIVGCLMISLSIEALHHARARADRAEALARAAAIRAEGEEALRRTVGDLTRSNRDLEQFAYVASHDLQEPLRMIQAYLGLIQDRLRDRLDPQTEGYFTYVVDSASRMQGLIHDLLAYARVGADPGRTRARANLQVCLQQALAPLQETIASTGAAVTWDCLPTVGGDASQLVQVFQNLVGNALKFRGVEAVRIHIGATVQQGELRVSVRDNGIGIDPQAHLKVFDIFQRMHGRGRYPGTGIGLAICKKIVEQHGGRIWVVSSPNQGATFYFTIPQPSGGLA